MPARGPHRVPGAASTTPSLEAGQRILITGADGAVGGYAVQLAKAAGAHVIATASPRSSDQVRAQGADEVIDYTTTDLAAAVTEPVDVVLNLAPIDPAAVHGSRRIACATAEWWSARRCGCRPPATTSAASAASTCTSTATASSWPSWSHGSTSGDLKVDVARRVPLSRASGGARGRQPTAPSTARSSSFLRLRERSRPRAQPSVVAPRVPALISNQAGTGQCPVPILHTFDGRTLGRGVRGLSGRWRFRTPAAGQYPAAGPVVANRRWGRYSATKIHERPALVAAAAAAQGEAFLRACARHKV